MKSIIAYLQLFLSMMIISAILIISGDVYKLKNNNTIRLDKDINFGEFLDYKGVEYTKTTDKWEAIYEVDSSFDVGGLVVEYTEYDEQGD